MNAFFSMIETVIQNSMTIKIDQLAEAAINNMIAMTVADANANRAVNLRTMYNTATGSSITAAQAVTDPDFIRYASYIMKLYSERLQRMSKLFNVGGKERFTSSERLHVILLSEFAAAAEAYLYSNTYHDQFVHLSKAETVPYWQGSGVAYDFASTSKISMAGAGIAAMAASKANLDFVKKSMTIQTIGYDKVNQLRHVRYFKDIDGIKAHMKKHADIMRPKFEMVCNTLESSLGELNIGKWIKPKGGYFVSFDSLEGCANVAKCKEAGITLANAGATYPYGIDPKDTNIRIAPSYPTTKELEEAMQVFTLCVKLVSAERLLEK